MKQDRSQLYISGESPGFHGGGTRIEAPKARELRRRRRRRGGVGCGVPSPTDYRRSWTGGATWAPPVGSAAEPRPPMHFGIFEAHRTAHKSSIFRKRPLNRSIRGHGHWTIASWLSVWVWNIFGHNCLQTEKFSDTTVALFILNKDQYIYTAWRASLWISNS